MLFNRRNHKKCQFLVYFFWSITTCQASSTNRLAQTNALDNVTQAILPSSIRATKNKTSVAIQDDCPIHCFCSNIINTVKCERGLTALPNILPAKALSLTYTDSLVKNDTLSQFNFREFQNLTTLQLRNNSIHFIAKRTFKTMKKLKTLVLDDNPIAAMINVRFLSELPLSLEILSLSNVLSPNSEPSLVWWLFYHNKVQNKTENLKMLPSQYQNLQTKGVLMRFQNLKELSLDRNRLEYIDLRALQGIETMTSLKKISLSNNRLANISLFNVLKMFNRKKPYPKILPIVHQRNNADPIAKLAHHEDVAIIEVWIDLSDNNINTLNESILHLFEEISAAGTLPSYGRTADTSGQFKPTIWHILRTSLKGNPVDCSCSVEPLMKFLFDGSGKSIIRDWRNLQCKNPYWLEDTSLYRLNLLSYNVCYDDLTERFRLSVTQLIFITICSLVLTAVSSAVAYLNRRKILFYWRIIRNCGVDDDMGTSVKWRNTVNKYSVPNDHKGVGHRGYYSDELIVFDKDNESENVPTT